MNKWTPEKLIKIGAIHREHDPLLPEGSERYVANDDVIIVAILDRDYRDHVREFVFEQVAWVVYNTADEHPPEDDMSSKMKWIMYDRYRYMVDTFDYEKSVLEVHEKRLIEPPQS